MNASSVVEIGGRVAISARALERTVTAIAAARLGVSPRDVTVRLTDDAGLLAIAVSGPVRLAPLRSPRRGEGIPARILDARAGIRDDVTAIAGAHVGTVAVSLTRVQLSEERRVR
jgi:hypothetical protein